MEKSISLVLFLLIVCSSCQNAPQQEKGIQVGKALSAEVEMLANDQLRFVELSGTPYERGYTHGKLLKQEIQEVIRLFKEDIKQTTNEDPDQFITAFLDYTDYRTAIEKWTPSLLEELKGISDGSGVDLETIFMHQLGDEYWFNTRDVVSNENTYASVIYVHSEQPQFIIAPGKPHEVDYHEINLIE